MSSTIANILAAAKGSFPFDLGLWESAGAGYCVPNGHNITTPAGSSDTTLLGGLTIYALGWVNHLGTNCFVLVLSDVLPAAVSSIDVQLSGGPVNTYTPGDGDLSVNPANSDLVTYLWQAGFQDFADGQSTTVTFNGVSSVLVQVGGKFAAAPKLGGPIVQANVGNIVPKIYMPKENTTVQA